MPLRPRSHQLEDESIRAFECAIPSSWVFRRQELDYGIDGQVEVFDRSSGEATGFMFLLQFKATENQPVDEVHSVRLDSKTLAYYRRLDLPVLLVLYSASSHELFHAWCHRVPPDRLLHKTFAFRLGPDSRWSERTSKQVETDLAAMRQISHPPLQPRLRMALSGAAERVGQTPMGRILSVVRSKVDATPTVTRTGAIPESHAAMKLSAGCFNVSVVGTPDMAFSWPSTDAPPDVLASDVMVGMALALANVGRYDIGLDLVSRHGSASGMLSVPEIRMRVVFLLARASSLPGSSRILQTLLLDSDNPLSHVLMLPALLSRDNVDDTVVEALEKLVQLWAKSQPSQLLSQVYYNVGNFMRLHSMRKALRYYLLAKRNDTAYVDRGYFCKELAGILFELGRYRCSVSLYERALLHDGVGANTLLLLADALLFAGEYERSCLTFEQAIHKCEEGAAEWNLKIHLLHAIHDMLKLTSQRRETRQARVLCSRAVQIEDLSEKHNLLVEALTKDALHSCSWFNLGVVSQAEGRISTSFECFLACALIDRRDPEAWANAVLLSLNSDEHFRLLPEILTTAYRFNGEEVLSSISRQLENDSQDRRDALTNQLSEIIGLMPREFAQPATIRLYVDTPSAHSVC